MKISRKQLRKLINEIADEIGGELPKKEMTIEDYLESVNYDVDPSLIDLLFTLKPLGFEVSSYNPEHNQLELERPVLVHDSTGETIFDELIIYDQTADLLTRYPFTKHYGFKSLGQAAMEIPRILEKQMK